jgi:hypothetical protein
MTEFGGIHACLHFEFLQRIDRRKDDVRVEIGIGVAYAVERVIVIHDAMSAGRDRLVGAVAALPRPRLTGGRRKIAHVGSHRHQTQVIAPVERELYDSLVFDHAANGRVFGLQQGGGGGNLDGFGYLADLKREIQTHGLLHLHLDVIAGHGSESRMSDFEIVNTGRHRGEGVESISRTFGITDGVGAGVG